MLFGRVELPLQLIDAHREGRLVLFVGAGASRADPSSLPLFGDLACRIADDCESGHPTSGEDLAAFLTKLEDDGADIQKRTRDHLSPVDSRPNEWHEAIAALAASRNSVRIVTTNYDRHLSIALAAASPGSPEYVGPALPMGDDFEGLVYLHGSLEPQDSRLVITDRDFGAAYLTDFWATRFLERLFRAYDVLFVGYGHSDVVMNYIARGLSIGKAALERQRFILLSGNDEAVRLEALGLTPIVYPVEAGRHDAAPEALAKWANRASMGLLEHRAQLSQILSSPPSGDAEEASYIEDVIASPDLVPLFAQHATDRAWLDWLSDRDPFRRLFQLADPVTDVSKALASWFVREHVTKDEERSTAALGWLAAHGGKLSEALRSELSRSLDLGTSWLEPWIVVLLASPTASSATRVGMAYGLEDGWSDEVILSVFDAAIAPTLVALPTRFGPARARFEVVPAASESEITSTMELIRPLLERRAGEVVDMLEHCLRLQLRFNTSFGISVEGWDRASWGRAAIEDDGQNMGGALDRVIDAARDALLALVGSDSVIADRSIEKWVASRVPLLRRLAIHCVFERNDRSADEKLQWALDHGLIQDWDGRHEVYNLLSLAGAASDDVLESMIGQVLEDDGGEGWSQSALNRLAWISDHAPDRAPSSDALAAFKASHPDLERSAHPNYRGWIESGWGRSPSDDAVERLHQTVTESPRLAVRGLIERLSAPESSGVWLDASPLEVVRQLTALHPEDGLTILAELEDCGAEAATEARIVQSLIEGWRYADLTESMAQTVALDLAGFALLGEVALATARMLSRQTGYDKTAWERVPAARSLASLVWSSAAPLDSEPTYELVMNSPEYLIAAFWVNAAISDRQAAGDRWSGMSAGVCEALDKIVDDATVKPNGVAGLAVRIRVLDSLDADWTRGRVLPLFDSDTHQVAAVRIWPAFLAQGSWTPELLSCGLLDAYVQCARRIETLECPLDKELLRHLAEIALYGETNPAVPQSWLRTLTRDWDAGRTAALLSAVASELRGSDTLFAEQQWDEWIRDYWSQRVSAIPRPLQVEEGAALVELIPHLGSRMEAAIELAIQSPARLAAHGDLLFRLERLDDAHCPPSVPALVAHLLGKTTNEDFPTGSCGCLRRIVDRAPDPMSTDVESIKEHAQRLKCDLSRWV